VAMQMLSVELWLKLARRRNGLKGSVCSTNFQTPLHPLGSFGMYFMSVCMHAPMYHHRPSSFIAIQLELASLLPFGWGERMCVETSVVWMESQGVIVVL